MHFSDQGVIRLREMNASSTQEDIDSSTGDQKTYSPNRRKSSSFLAVRDAVYQLTCLNDFSCENLGAGFFADVYKVKHKATGEVMVLKMNRCSQNKKLMLAEIQLLNRLSHPNILGFKGSCVHEGQLHALTEYINGGTLEDILQDKTIFLPWSIRIKMAADIARGMAYLHSKGVFHRDLTSKNCLVHNCPNGSIKIVVADFGLAAKIKHKQKRRSYTEAVGSAYWMAPECLHGREYCEKADVFSYGIILAEILSRLPADPEFMPRTRDFGVDFEVLRSLVDDDCPDGLWNLLLQCSQFNPDKRPVFLDIADTLESIDTGGGDDPFTTWGGLRRTLISSQSEPLLKLTEEEELGAGLCGEELRRREETDGSYEFIGQSPATPTPQCDLEDTLSSLLDGNEGCGQEKRNDFLIQGSVLTGTSTPDRKTTPTPEHKTGDSGIDLGPQKEQSVDHAHSNTRGLQLTKTDSPLTSFRGGGTHYRETSDSSELSFHLPSPSYAWAPPSSPLPLHKNSFSFPSSPDGLIRPTNLSVSSCQDIENVSPERTPLVNDVGVARHLSGCSCKDHAHLYKVSLSTPNLQSV